MKEHLNEQDSPVTESTVEEVPVNGDPADAPPSRTIEESVQESPANSGPADNVPAKGSSSGLFSGTRGFLLVLLPALFLALLLFAVISGMFPPPRTAEEKTDRTPPSIMLTRDNRYFVRPGEEYEEEGYAAYDNLDGDLTKKVEVSVGKDMVCYRVMDTAGNITIRFRRIPYASGNGSGSGTD